MPSAVPEQKFDPNTEDYTKMTDFSLFSEICAFGLRSSLKEEGLLSAEALLRGSGCGFGWSRLLLSFAFVQQAE